MNVQLKPLDCPPLDDLFQPVIEYPAVHIRFLPDPGGIAAKKIHYPAPGYLKDPGGEMTAVLVAGQSFDDAHEGLPGQVFGVLGVFHAAVKAAVEGSIGNVDRTRKS